MVTDRDIENVCEWIRNYLGADKRAIVGLSGGVDSAVVAALCVKALGNDRVLGVIMPCHSKPKDKRLALKVVNQLEIDYAIVNLSTAFNNWAKTYAKSFGLRSEEDLSVLTKGNAKARLRMTTLYAVAGNENGIVIGTTNMSEAMIGYACYDEITRAMTPDGPKYYNELKKGDIVFSMNINTRQIEEIPVADIYIDNYIGEMLQIKTKRVDLLVTPNHKLVVSKNHGKGPVHLVEARKRMNAGGTCIPFPLPWNNEHEESKCEVINTAQFLLEPNVSYNSNKPIIMETNDFLYLMGLFIGDGYLNSSSMKYQGSNLSYAEFTKTYRDANTGRFVKTNLEKVSKEYLNYRICISSCKEKRSRLPLETLLTKYNINFTSTDSAILFSNKALSDCFSKCGHLAQNKRIPKWVLKLSSSRLEALYKGLMDSDGNADGSGYNTTSKKLVYQFIELCFKTGRTANYIIRPPRTTQYKGKTIRSGECFYIGVASKCNNWAFRENNIKSVNYSGTIWCPSVPPYNNLVVERNGKIIVCGNTKYGDHGVDIEPIGWFYKHEVYELAAMLHVPKQIIERAPTAGLWDGQTDEGELGLTYDQIDEALKKYFDGGDDAMVSENEQKILSLIISSAHKRKSIPVCMTRETPIV